MALGSTIRNFFAMRQPAKDPVGRDLPITMQQYIEQMSYLGNRYPVLNQTMPGTGGEEKVASNFAGIVNGAYKANGIVFACMLARQMLFQEARYLFRELGDDGRPGKFMWHDSLRVLEKPWSGGTTGDINARAIQNVDLSGNFFMVRLSPSRMAWLRPDWTSIIAASPNEDADVWDPEAEVIGYAYHPGGPAQGRKPIFYEAERVAHWAPLPDPVARFRGVPWTATIIPEIESDNAATIHKRQFFSNGATPNLLVHFDPDVVDSLEKFDAYVDAIDSQHTGVLNAYKTLYLTGATDAKTIGTDLRQLDFKATQGAGETRIAAAAGVPASIVGISEGLQGSALNAGNYASAFRRFADLFARPNWRTFAAALENIVPPPGSNSPMRRSQLWYDDRDIPALRQDEREKADIQQIQAAAIASYVTAGFTPESAEEAVATGETSKLKHSGLYSVQLHPPGSTETKPPGEFPQALGQNGSNGKEPADQEVEA